MTAKSYRCFCGCQQSHDRKGFLPGHKPAQRKSPKDWDAWLQERLAKIAAGEAKRLAKKEAARQRVNYLKRKAAARTTKKAALLAEKAARQRERELKRTLVGRVQLLKEEIAEMRRTPVAVREYARGWTDHANWIKSSQNLPSESQV